MGLILKVVLICVALGGIGLGNLGFRGDSPESIASGVIGVIVSLIAMTFLLKFLWRFLGCLTTILIALVLIVILLILTGTFDTVTDKIKGFISGVSKQEQISGNIPGYSAQAVSSDAASAAAPVNYIPVVNSDGTTSFVPISSSKPATPMQQARKDGTFTGSISAIRTGGQFVIGDLEVILYGIDVPDPKQVCSDKRGRPYNCGQEAIRELRRFTGESSLSCKVKAQGNRENLVYAVCNIDNHDLGVAMVQNGWAFAVPNITGVYVPYEEVAKSSGKGMWGGQFYKPSEWRAKEAQAQQAAKKSGAFFGGLF